MNASEKIEQLSLAARAAVRAADWQTTGRCAQQILALDRDSAEGHFLSGLVAKTAARSDAAEESFRKAMQLHPERYDAGIELADLYVRLQRWSDAIPLLENFVSMLGNSPLYLEMAAQAYSRLDLHEQAWPLYATACELQPEVERFQAGLAACSVFVGKNADARKIYESLLEAQPNHQRYHYELAKLATARDASHVERMQAVLHTTALPPARNIYIYYALGKELEDLGRWDEAFDYYAKAGQAVKSVSPYKVETDLELMDVIIATCTAEWIQRDTSADKVQDRNRIPVFIVGLPRSGTTLTERIVASHSAVDSVGETFFLPMAIKNESGIKTTDSMNPAIISAAAAKPVGQIAARYVDAVRYRLGQESMFIEKLPENFLYLGFIAREFPNARLVHLRRNPLDSCFAMYKQSYFRYAFSLDDIGRYYVAYRKLMDHWQSMLGDRLIEVRYEQLVSDQEGQTRYLLERLGLDFESACLAFEKNLAPTRTASTVQVREKMHSRSVGRWEHFARQLAPLKNYLEAQGVETGP